MKLIDYVKNHILWILCSALILVVINGILFASTSIHQSYIDIFYMDLLIVFILLINIFYGFIKAKKKYEVVFNSSIETLEKNKVRNDYFIDMLIKVSKKQQNNFLKAEEDYKNGINEIQDYTTQWVHDIKVNIAVCELLLNEINLESSRELRNQIEQIKFRINHILHVTRANHYDQDISAGVVDVCHILRSAIKENALFFINKNIEIETNLTPFSVISDERWIYYIFGQILNNSSKYAPEGGTLTITTKEEKQAYYIIIKDNGIGISKEDLSRIFNKGFTGKNGKVGTKSTGMGLYYAKKMADKLSIGIEVDSVEGEYTEFHIIFYKLSDYYKVANEAINN
ncbi:MULTISPECIES: ATP-binding protein [Bacillus amyloliquefaciens group]|uniref:ATP-binding protein n=1 Tax=Bacillus amyloliquefaciens group TaxID=1938374 RepID=UPI000B517DBB|nr:MULTISPECIES: sensor histidine kinase [Bacillus amyloliquefaciens group]ASF27458.1 histidine kinase [Bacillus amyloliquefaciens]MDQ8093553.1 sensor histidine kinase [Bacillus amyloliquefaciens]